MLLRVYGDQPARNADVKASRDSSGISYAHVTVELDRTMPDGWMVRVDGTASGKFPTCADIAL